MPADERRKDRFSSGFTGLNEPGKTHIEKIISHLSDLPPPQEPVPPTNPETPANLQTIEQ
jgi:hypothetical protein